MSDLIVPMAGKALAAALRGKIVLVDFEEPWCGSCQIERPELEEVARAVAGRALVAKVNVDEAQQLAADFGIQSIPTLILFKNGRVVKKFVGKHSRKVLVAAIENLVEGKKKKRTGTRRRP
jgi:thioredoxin 1